MISINRNHPVTRTCHLSLYCVLPADVYPLSVHPTHEGVGVGSGRVRVGTVIFCGVIAMPSIPEAICSAGRRIHYYVCGQVRGVNGFAVLQAGVIVLPTSVGGAGGYRGVGVRERLLATALQQSYHTKEQENFLFFHDTELC